MSIYTSIPPEDIVTAYQSIVTTGLWSGDTGSLASQLYIDETTQIAHSKEYYFDVYNADPDTASESAEVQFAVAYGHVDGGGSPSLLENQTSTLASQAIYSQYRNLLLEPSDAKFSFNNVESDHIYVINIQRARMREQFDPGNWELPLSGANGLRTYIDDSKQGTLSATSVSTTRAGKAFAIISGALDGTAAATTSSLSYNGRGFGIVYPDVGIIVLNPDAICPDVGFYVTSSGITTGSAASSALTVPFYNSNIFSANTITSTRPVAPVTHSVIYGAEKSAFNHAGLFVSLNLAVKGTTEGFKARSAEKISSTHYFVRLRNRDYNYSNNPTFYNPDSGVVVYADFADDPQVYITTVGLYNDQNELLAVAKLSKPVPKSFDEEVLLRVRLDF